MTKGYIKLRGGGGGGVSQQQAGPLGSPSRSYLFPSPAGLLQPYLGLPAEPAALAKSATGIPHPGRHPGTRPGLQ